MAEQPAWSVGVASRRDTRDHNCDAARVHTGPDGVLAAAVIDGTGNSAELATLAGVLAEVTVRIGARRGGMAALITAGDLIHDEHEAAAVVATADEDRPVHVWWVGDCRASWWDSGASLRAVTTDHTMGQQLRASGGVPVDLAATHDHWLLIGLADATPSTIRQVWVPDYGQDLGAGELVLLTSDGVHDAVPHDELVALIREQRDPQDLAEVIVAAAREDDGYRDDATVVALARRC